MQSIPETCKVSQMGCNLYLIMVINYVIIKYLLMEVFVIKKCIKLILSIIIMVVIIWAVIKKSAILEEKEALPTAWEEEDEIFTDNESNSSVEIENYVKLQRNREFKILSVKQSKECALPKMMDIEDANIVFKEGRLTSAHSFFYITIKLINNTDEEDEASIYNHRVEVWKNGEIIKHIYPYMIAGKLENMENHDYFHVMVQPNTEEDVEVLYIVEDEYMDPAYDLKLCLDPSGMEGMILSMIKSNEGVLPEEWENAVAYFDLKGLMEK